MINGRRGVKKTTVVTPELWAKWLDQHGFELVDLPHTAPAPSSTRPKSKAWNKRV